MVLLQIAREFGFDLLDTRQAGVKGLGQGTDELVFGNAHGFVDTRERVFGHQAFLVLQSSRPMVGLSSEALTWASMAAR